MARSKTKPQWKQSELNVVSQPEVGSGDVHVVSRRADVSPGRSDYDAYRKMRRDPTIAMARAAAHIPVKFAEWSVTGEDDEAVEAVEELLERIWRTTVRDLLHAVDYGWISLEKVWTIDKDLRWSVSLKPLRHDVTKIVVDRETGEVAGVQQGETFVDSFHSVVFSHDSEYGNPYGRSRLENLREHAWKPWLSAVSQLKRYTEKACGVVPMVRYPIGTTKTAGGATIDNSRLAKLMIESLASVRGVTMPWKLEKWAEEMTLQGVNPKDVASWQIEFMDVPSGAGGEMLATAEYFDKLKSRGYLVPERVIQEAQHGSRADAEAHSDVAIAIASEVLGDIEDCVNEQVVDDFVEVNFGPELRGEIRVEVQPVDPEKRAFARSLTTAVLQDPNNADLVQSVLDLDALVDMFGVPRRGTFNNMGAANGLPQVPTLNGLPPSSRLRLNDDPPTEHATEPDLSPGE